VIVPRRYLLGPVTDAFAAERLGRFRGTGECLTFGPGAGVDVVLGGGESWRDILARLPKDWRPEFIVLRFPAAGPIPSGMWTAPVPLTALAGDHACRVHHYRRALRQCELVWSDSPGVEMLTRAGIARVRHGRPYGCGQNLIKTARSDDNRDIDVLYVGSLNFAIDRELLPLLAIVASLADGWRVVIRRDPPDTERCQLLRRTKILFTRGRCEEACRDVFEGAAAGALVFSEDTNREVDDLLVDRQDCVRYNARNLTGLVAHYLSHEIERRALAETARQRGLEWGFEHCWERMLEKVDSEWNEITLAAARRSAPDAETELLTRTWAAIDPNGSTDVALVHDLTQLLAERPSSTLHNALGLAVSLSSRDRDRARIASLAAEHFRRALAAEPEHAVASLNLAEALAAAGRHAEAVEQAQRTIDRIELRPDLDPSWLDSPAFPAVVGVFRAEWERAAREHAGNMPGEARAKRALLLWRLHGLIARHSEDLAHRYEALLQFPDLPATRAALGAALVRAGRTAEAVPHLRRAIADNPFHSVAARALHEALATLGRSEEQEQLVRDYRRLATAASGLVPAEPWFAQRSAGELVSIIILCCNEVGYTRLCLESVLRHTRVPYELVLVDNASTDDTPSLLREMSGRPGPERIVILSNTHNVGFPAACNQGAARATGRYNLFLNNEAVVTAGWLEGLVDQAQEDSVGLVAAVSNYAAPPQRVDIDYRGIEGIDAFAAARRRSFRGQVLEATRLNGFCLLAPQEVFDKVGGFDKRFGRGFFDDDDLSLRVRRAGYRLLVAQEVFIHHFGGGTFAAQGVSVQRQLEENLPLFREKWGEAVTAAYRLPPVTYVADVRADGEVHATTGPVFKTKQRVSLCMIVRDEEANLTDCLTPVVGLFDEIVVVDTGSKDATKLVAAGFGARIVDFPWRDSFAAARNESLRHATGDWAFWLDADDRIDAGNRAKLRTLFDRLKDEDAAYLIDCRCPALGENSVTVAHARLFRLRPDVRWQYRVHEQILLAIQERGGITRRSDVIILHEGYRDAECFAAKLQRNLRLLRLDAAELPDDPFVQFYLGFTLLLLGKPADAVPCLRHSLACAPPGMSIIPKAYALYSQALARQSGAADALAACREGRARAPADAELLFLEANLLRELGDLRGAEQAFCAALDAPEATPYSGLDTGLRGYKARHNLALLYRQAGRLDEAAAHWRAAAKERPDFVDAWLGLGDLYQQQGRAEDLDQVLAELDRLRPGGPEAASLRARGHVRL
jgi:GT2 family glycosyltransferase/tetratricopeptide (TPR) repeat protein